MKRIGAVLLALFAFAIPTFADEFSSVAKRIESHYGVRRTHPHLIGFALFLTKPATWGSGVGGLKVAAFEAENRAFTPSIPELDKIVRDSIGREWRPFVRVDSRRDGEATVIYTNFSGNRMRMLIASIERDDISVVQMKIDGKVFKRWADDPKDEANGVNHK
jgi:hypothetical protein